MFLFTLSTEKYTFIYIFPFMLHCPPISDLSTGYGSLRREPAGPATSAGDASYELTEQVAQVYRVPGCASQSGSDVITTKSLYSIFTRRWETKSPYRGSRGTDGKHDVLKHWYGMERKTAGARHHMQGRLEQHVGTTIKASQSHS
jgi:hypothetical protein